MFWRNVVVRLGIITVSVLMMLPGLLTTAEVDKKQASCAENLKNLYQALQMYCQDNNGMLPEARGFGSLISNYMNRDEKDVFGIDYLKCPSAIFTKEENHSYGINYWYIFDSPSSMGHQSRVLAKVPSTTFLCADGGYGVIYNPDNWKLTEDRDKDGVLDSSGPGVTLYNGFSPRHNGGGNFLFADGSVKWVSLQDFLKNKDKLWGDNARP